MEAIASGIENTMHGGLQPSTAAQLKLRESKRSLPWTDHDALRHLPVSPQQLDQMKDRLLRALQAAEGDEERRCVLFAWRHVNDEYYSREYDDKPRILDPLPDVDSYPFLVYEESYAPYLRNRLAADVGIEEPSLNASKTAKRRWELIKTWMVQEIRKLCRQGILFAHTDKMALETRPIVEQLMRAWPKQVVGVRFLDEAYPEAFNRFFETMDIRDRFNRSIKCVDPLRLSRRTFGNDVLFDIHAASLQTTPLVSTAVASLKMFSAKGAAIAGQHPGTLGSMPMLKQQLLPHVQDTHSLGVLQNELLEFSSPSTNEPSGPLESGGTGVQTNCTPVKGDGRNQHTNSMHHRGQWPRQATEAESPMSPWRKGRVSRAMMPHMTDKVHMTVRTPERLSSREQESDERTVPSSVYNTAETSDWLKP